MAAMKIQLRDRGCSKIRTFCIGRSVETEGESYRVDTAGFRDVSFYRHELKIMPTTKTCNDIDFIPNYKIMVPKPQTSLAFTQGYRGDVAAKEILLL
jgi:hypothetical protein